MFSKLFGKSQPEDKLADTPSIMGLRLGGSFEVDALLLKLIEDQLVVQGVATRQIIQAAGVVDLDGSWVFRFYTDDDAFLQVIAEGGKSDEHVVDVKLFHFYDTQDVSQQTVWDTLLRDKMGTASYRLEGRDYQRVWTSASDYHNPVHMAEKTYDSEGDYSLTDQFTMLFERPLEGDLTESLFLSAEEKQTSANLERCFVLSTGISLTPSQITIHG